MCRLYGMRATHPTRVECELLDAQHSLLHQAKRDRRGMENPHGWGMGWFNRGKTHCARQVEPANESQDYRTSAARTEGTAVIAHIRRATVGRPRRENTHPFRDGQALLAHNGHIENFDEIRHKLLAQMPERNQKAIQGTTDSEHFFQLALSKLDTFAPDEMREALMEAVDTVRRCFTGEVEDEMRLALNTLFIAGGNLAGTRLRRTLWYLERSGTKHCPVCGKTHDTSGTTEDYRAVVLASERLTDEDWKPVPKDSAFYVDEESMELKVKPLDI
ncbi:MAG: class II glutamine amidotransferase [Bradymonadaceae bacterium]